MCKIRFRAESYTLAALAFVLICAACASEKQSTGHVVLASTTRFEAQMQAQPPQPEMYAVPKSDSALRPGSGLPRYSDSAAEMGSPASGESPEPQVAAALPDEPPSIARAMGTKGRMRSGWKASGASTGNANPLSQASARSSPAPDGIALVDRAVASMRSAKIAFNAPSALQVNESAQVQLLLSLKQDLEDLKSELTDEGQKEGAEIKVSGRMEARLSGQNFQITAATPEEQGIASQGVTEWHWEVAPTAPGRQHLHLTITALLEVEGKTTRRAIRTFDKVIEVNVTWYRQAANMISENWQWAWGALLVPGFGWWLKKSKKTRTVRRRATG